MFTHLHVHTEYSMLDGLSRIEPLVIRAKELGMDSLAITDHGGMYGVVDLITAGGHSFMVLSTAVGVLAVFSRQTLLKDISLSAWVVICSVLLRSV